LLLSLNFVALLEDDYPLDNMPESTDIPYRDILDRIKYEDEHQDHTKDSLTAD